MGDPINLDRARAMRKIVYGARCTWWDSIDKIGIMPGTDRGNGMGGLPCCPHCRGVLYEMDSIEPWNAGMARYEAAGHPGYTAMMTWARGRCFPNLAALEKAYAERAQ